MIWAGVALFGAAILTSLAWFGPAQSLTLSLVSFQGGTSGLSKLLKKLSRFDALIIDDLGYVQQSRQEMEVLFTLLAERYERGSVMITSNLPFSQWEAIFQDPMTTAAAIDRLVHHSVILELNVPSYRVEQAKKGRMEEP
jgi:DNA replication protein DnaC